MSEGTRKPSLFAKYSDLMGRKIKGVEIGCYSVALIGLTYAIRKVRPFSRFKRPFDIPKRFVKEKKELTGIVERIEPNGGLLMINHEPLIAIPGTRGGELPTKLAGVELKGHAISWLQTLVAGNRVRFIPVNRNEKYVECEVKLDQTLPKNQVRTIDLGAALVQVEFASVIERPLTRKDQDYPYYMTLKNAENAALRKKMGIRYYIKPTKLMLMTLGTQLSKLSKKLIQSSMKKKSKVPKLAITA